jgi:hypothetical protein
VLHHAIVPLHCSADIIFMKAFGPLQVQAVGWGCFLRGGDYRAAHWCRNGYGLISGDCTIYITQRLLRLGVLC